MWEAPQVPNGPEAAPPFSKSGGLRSVVCRLWSAVFGLRSVVCGQWSVVCGLRSVGCCQVWEI